MTYPEDVDIAELYHENTKNRLFQGPPPGGMGPGGEMMALELMDRSVKSYPYAPVFQLPRVQEPLSIPLESALYARRSDRSFGPGNLPLESLARLLYGANGIKDAPAMMGYHDYRRNTPSAGNLGSIELYPLVFGVEGLAPGIYHYHALTHCLELLRRGDFRSTLATRMVFQPEFAGAQVFLVLAASIWRVRMKYGDRGYRYVHLDAGHAGQNIYLISAALGLACCGIGGFLDDEVNAFVGLDGLNESIVYALAVGNPGVTGP